MRYTDMNDRTVVTSFLDRWIPVHFVSTARPLLLLLPKGQAVFVPLSVMAEYVVDNSVLLGPIFSPLEQSTEQERLLTEN